MMAAVRLSFVWFGVRKSLTSEQKSQAAETFGAEGDFLSAGKKLLDTRHPAFKAVTSVRSQLISLWRSLSLPYPEPGLRLIRQDDVELFNERAHVLKAELADAVARLDEHFGELKSAARQRLVGFTTRPTTRSRSAGCFKWSGIFRRSSHRSTCAS